MTLLDQASAIQDKIDVTYSEAYAALELANITLETVRNWLLPFHLTMVST